MNDMQAHQFLFSKSLINVQIRTNFGGLFVAAVMHLSTVFGTERYKVTNLIEQKQHTIFRIWAKIGRYVMSSHRTNPFKSKNFLFAFIDFYEVNYKSSNRFKRLENHLMGSKIIFDIPTFLI